MNESQIIITEQCGSLGQRVRYIKGNGQSAGAIRRSSIDETLANSLTHSIKDVLRDIFLPHGYPETVSDDYFDYQIWDTVQAFCSTITGTFTTRAILKGVGVGDSQATPLAAAITWVCKDGTGMLGRILFAWWKGNELDGNCKKWRLCADFLNDGAMFLELLVPYVSRFSLQILCMTTAMKAIVGVAGSATRASITQHQAIKGNMADVSAKDGSQETFVNLVASMIGIFLLALFSEGQYEWLIFSVLTIVHLGANYFAVKSLVFSHLNNARYVAALNTYLRYDAIPNPIKINEKESVVVGCGLTFKDLCYFDVKVGSSLKKVIKSYTSSDLAMLVDIYKNRKYILVPDIQKRVIYVALQKGETAEDIISAYYHAVLLAIAICIFNKINLPVYAKRQLHHLTPIIRLNSVMKTYPKNESGEEELPLNILKTFDDFVTQELVMLFTALKINDWNTDAHSLTVGKWRCDWKSNPVLSSKNSTFHGKHE